MARIGLKSLTYATISTGGEGSAVVYTGGATKGDMMMRAEVTLNHEDVKMYADNHAVERANGVIGGSIALELAKLPNDVKTALLGYVADGNKLTVTEDPAPYVGFGYLTCEIEGGVKGYVGYWFPKCQFGLDSDSYDAAVAAGQVPEEVQMQVSGAIASQMANMDETIDAETDAQTASLIETNMQSDEVQAQIAEGVQKAAGGRRSLQALKAQLDSYSGFYYGIISYTDGVDQANAGAQEILGGTVSLKDGAQSLADGAGQLKGGTKELKSGADTLKAGSAQLKDGADALHSGAVTLDGGMLQLYNGIGTLNSGAGALLDGVTQLENGAQQLDAGMQKLKKEGVDALVKAADGDLTSLADRAKAMIRASKKYQSFSGLGDNTDGKVDFIFKTDAVKKEK